MPSAPPKRPRTCRRKLSNLPRRPGGAWLALGLAAAALAACDEVADEAEPPPELGESEALEDAGEMLGTRDTPAPPGAADDAR